MFVANVKKIKIKKEQIKKSFDFCIDYKKFLDFAKTERETISFINDSANKSKKKIHAKIDDQHLLFLDLIKKGNK